MVLTDFLTETRRKWLQALKLFKSKKNRKSARNRVSPALERCVLSGTVDARPEIDVQHFCPCRTSQTLDSYENSSYYSGCSSDSHGSLRSHSGRSGRSDSAYDSDARSSPAHRPAHASSPAPRPTYVTYFVHEEDSSSVHTEYTLLDYEPPDEEQQNIINESIELVTTL